MIENDCGAIPVIDFEETKKLVGILTDRDITCRAVAKGKSPYEFTANDCMTRTVATVTPEMTIEECCRVMEEYHVRRVPVVDDYGSCCGIVSQADIAKSAPVLETAEVVREISMAA